MQAQSDYLLIPGHGLTNRTDGRASNAVTIGELIRECQSTGPWMRFIEREYDWAELQDSGAGNTPGEFKLGNPGIGRIVAEAVACSQAGLKLRVMLTHKFSSLPQFLTRGWKYATGDQTTDPKETSNIKLDKPEVLGFLEDLYRTVISELGKSPGASEAFYGFVIQEHEVGTSNYWTTDTRSSWIENLKAFHLWLAGREWRPELNAWTWVDGRLRNFSPGSTHPHRLFWQMVNSPTTEVKTIIAHLLDSGKIGMGGGICGPDTFPREPGPTPSHGGARGALFRCYEEMRAVRNVLPMSLHVYHLNYWNPYVHAAKNDVNMNAQAKDMDPLIAPQPFWGRQPELPSVNGAANGNAGIGIANFLGCVPEDQQDPDNLRVNNVVWSYVKSIPPEARYQNPSVAEYGWPDVRDWMRNAGVYASGRPLDSTSQFARAPDESGAFAGGCNAITPSSIRSAPAQPSRLLNLSTRGSVRTGDNLMILGFVIQGSSAKRLLVRAAGPSLGNLGVKNFLSDPVLTLNRQDGSVVSEIASNDNWGASAGAAAIRTATTAVGAFPLLEGSADAALLVDLQPGLYTALVRGAGSLTGIGIVELYDAGDVVSDARLVNISTRGFCGIGEEIIIPGFIISPGAPKTLLIRVVGPTLGDAPFNVSGTMTDPMLTLHRQEANGSSTVMLTQNDWGDASDPTAIAQAAVLAGAFSLAAGSGDAAIVVTLDPGAYTVHGASEDGVGTGVVLVEVYALP
ncbi:MAG: hypothetical protein KBA71_03495 [Opitutaceae bacterium]|nr:hypothetical protein [Opitutaceae bacterium]